MDFALVKLVDQSLPQPTQQFREQLTIVARGYFLAFSET